MGISLLIDEVLLAGGSQPIRLRPIAALGGL
jgi:hypothetical protein